MIFVDTDGFVALALTQDSNHARAVAISKGIKARKEHLVTSAFSFGETVTVISQKGGREKALQFVDMFLASGTVVVEADESLREEGILVYRNQTSKNVSFTDCANMAIMRREKIKEVFSFDRIYKKNGFTFL